ncbi:hypothetical protein AN219_17200 [Streptomyces nanshensis]|nr:hypothetical protein AN219_17200 [Streptomyces nanshensis]
MDSTPQIETREIADNELDMISGGVGDLNIAPMTDAGQLGQVSQLGQVTAPVSQLTDAISGVNGSL